jgi:hypothetical protein
LYTAGVEVAASVEHNGFDALCKSLSRNVLTYNLSSLNLGESFYVYALSDGRRRYQRVTNGVVDNLRINVG